MQSTLSQIWFEIGFKLSFNQHFRSQFLKSYRIVTTKLIKTDLDLIGSGLNRKQSNLIDFNRKENKNYQFMSKKLNYIDFFNINQQSFNPYFLSFNPYF